MSTISEVANPIIDGDHSEGSLSKFIDAIRDRSGNYTGQEDTQFDYKETFPFSFTDDYFAGILRLIFAFYNSFGGVIIFGVNDKTRESGKNRVSINIERFNTRVREICGKSINIHHYNLADTIDNIDLLIVPRRAPSVPPVASLIDVGKYEPGIYWIRRGHEVLAATSKDISFLFSPRHTSSDDEPSDRILHFLPPNPAYIKTFVGRVGVLSELLSWITIEDEPRKFLWGRGGSGKSTIAYEFATLVRDFGGAIKTREGVTFDRVVYLTAKKLELLSGGLKIQPSKITDFANLDELLTAILHSCQYSDSSIDNLSTEAKIESVGEVMKYENILFVFDDIDTLTTQKIDAGIDLLYKLSIRSQSDIRILYTQRNAPVSIENAIEVPGFRAGREYLEFIKECSEQIGVPVPETDFMQGDLLRHSEGIPLIIETIIGLRKRSGAYEKALEIFLSRRGQEARRYLFEREYDALPPDNQARIILGAIAEFSTPVNFEAICAIVDFSDSSVADAIGALLGVFLSTQVSKEGDTQYMVNPVTSLFVSEKLAGLRFQPIIKERVRAYRAGKQKKPEAIVRLEFEVERAIGRREPHEAWSTITRSFPEAITENPEFRILRAMTAAIQSPPRVSEAREDFNYCLRMGFEHAQGMRVWWNMELKTGFGDDIMLRISDSVIDGKSYADTVRFEFLSRKASGLFHKARQMEYSNFADAYILLEKSMNLNAKSFVFFESAQKNTIKLFEHTRNAAYRLIQVGKQLEYDADLIRSFRNCIDEFNFIPDPLFDPLMETLGFLVSGHSEKTLKRRRNIAKSFIADVKKGKLRFEDSLIQERFLRLVPDV